MSTQELFKKFTHKMFNPPGLARNRLTNKSQHYIKARKLVGTYGMHAGVTPSPFPESVPSSGHRITKKDEKKILRKWYPNYREREMPVSVLAGMDNRLDKPMKTVRMRFRHSELRDVERAGGLEAILASSAARTMSDEGKLMRMALINQLHRIRERGDAPEEEEYYYEEEHLQVEGDGLKQLEGNGSGAPKRQPEPPLLMIEDGSGSSKQSMRLSPKKKRTGTAQPRETTKA